MAQVQLAKSLKFKSGMECDAHQPGRKKFVWLGLGANNPQAGFGCDAVRQIVIHVHAFMFCGNSPTVPS
jgi:hypothetical protein